MNHVQRIVHNSYYSTSDENSYLPLFCIFERLLALYYGILSHINYNRAIGQIPIGTLQQRNMYNFSSSLRKDYDAFFNEVDAQKDNSEIFKQGMFKGSYTFYKTIKAKVDEFLENHRHGVSALLTGINLLSIQLRRLTRTNTATSLLRVTGSNQHQFAMTHRYI